MALQISYAFSPPVALLFSLLQNGVSANTTPNLLSRHFRKSQENAHHCNSSLLISVSISTTMPSLYFAFPMSFLLVTFSLSSSYAHLFHDDRQSLLKFKTLITSDPGDSMADWNPTVPLCNWTAITCSHRHPNRAVALNLTAVDLHGIISPSLSNLSFLRSVDLSVNVLHGHIPPQLGRLFRLRTLWLDYNQLEGDIPHQLASCRNLISLALSFNDMSGNIPKELSSLPLLQELFLGTNRLTGTISPSFGNFSALTNLEIERNNLSGAIPPQLGLLTSLQTLYLHTNELSGPIPISLSNISTLISLEIAANKLSGSIPEELGLLSSLQTLFIAANELSGTIPTSLSNISSLIFLEIEENNIIGSIPQEFGLFTNLQQLYLYRNDLSGIIPISLSNISTLTDLEIDGNKLTGNIPQEMGLFARLQMLDLHENEMSGIIPTSLSNISTLIELQVHTNKLTGTIPQELGLLMNLQILALSQNEFSGTIPASLSNIVNLGSLSLWGNQLSGNIPSSIGNCSKLILLYLHYNKLTGSVPVELGKLSLLENLNLHSNQLDSGSTTTMPFLVALTNCSHLKTIHLSDNKLSGVLPLAIGRLSTNLSYLSLSGNMIEGNIPPHIGNLSDLSFLNLSGNTLNGSIPLLQNLRNLERLDLSKNRLEGNILDDFEQLQHLGLLDISQNILFGNIPNSLSSLKQLRRLLLHHNQLSGSIPTNLGDCVNLELLDLSHNMLTGSIPREMVELSNLHFYLNLSWNLLEGSLPMEIGKIEMAQDIDISANKLTGFIPPTLGSCSELQLLNLSQNIFQGSIPDSLGNLQSLMTLDLSSNSLSGTIPITLMKLKMVQYLNLSFNNLTGEIPKGGPFANRTTVMSFIGNPDLCGPQVFMLPACPRDHFAHIKKEFFLIGGAIAFIICCLLLGFLWRRSMHMKNFDFSHVTFQKLEHQRISYQELHLATDGFADTNLLGKGNFGIVYKGILSDGTLLAVKVLQLQNDQAEKSFKAECSVLQKVKHRNLVRIITSCSNLHFKGLVFQFMPNGSLKNHLYLDRDGNNGEVVCELGLKTRLDIAIDVAHAMEYLHHYTYVQVVHCDIKPDNVLLDEDMTGHVTDFGIARLIGTTSSDSLTSTLALKGSMGYIAPEYGLGEIVSTKGDVYSYGILLLEMLTRKKPTSDMFVGDLNLHKWVNLRFPNSVKEVIDINLFEVVDGNEFRENNVYKILLSLLRVGLICSKDSPEERPTMRDVVIMLESIREDLVENAVASRILRRSISNLLGNTNATMIDAPTSNDQSSSTF